MTNIFVTGGSRGIGAAVVARFAENGCRVGFLYKESERAALELSAATGAIPFCGDVRTRDDVARAIENFGDVDILICNAGISHFALFQDTAAEDWEDVFGVNFFGTVNAVNAALPSMLSRKSGRIVTVSSIFGLDGASCESAYSASKGAIIALTKSLADELVLSGIFTACVAPGFVDTEMNAR